MQDKQKSFIQISNVDYAYNSNNKPIKVLDGINLEIKQNEFVAILGSSGSGKSTLMNILGGLEQASSGDIIVDSQNISKFNLNELEAYRQYKVSFIFQFFNLLPTLTAIENVMLAMQAKGEVDIKVAQHFLEQVGLGEKMHRLPAQLSGGEQQRVAIARALSKKTPLILADEPTGNLDENTAKSIIDLLVEIQKQNQATLVLITHDNIIAQKAHRIVHLKQGKLA
ncbi:MAG: hypothetical protein RLZZ210_387 [Pseudomonadota bacterium]|jgi:putative ABC transport system ATP-binding protein